jgi:hypothetical protein
MKPRFLAALFALPPCAILALYACSSDSTNAAGDDASTGDGTGFEGSSIDVPGAVPVTQKGHIIVARKNSPAAGVVINTSAGSSAITDDAGAYSIQVPKGVPYNMTVTGDGFYKLIEQEWTIPGDTDRGHTSFLSMILGDILAASITDRDPNKGVLTVRVYATGGCPSVDGATISLDPPDGKTVYARGGLPSTETTVSAEELPSAIIYNLPTGVNLKLKAAHPTCTFVPYPAQADGFTYTGNVKTEGGKVISFARVFLTAPGSADAVPDAVPDAPLD